MDNSVVKFILLESFVYPIGGEKGTIGRETKYDIHCWFIFIRLAIDNITSKLENYLVVILMCFVWWFLFVG